MVKVDLITGFLGAGKTTFMQHYLKYLEWIGQKKVHIIENEFGAVDVDRRLLDADLEDISSLAGKCMCCTGLDSFKRFLIESAQNGYDRILVEPSGIYDVDEFFTVMNNPGVARNCEIGNIIMITDAVWDRDLGDKTRYLMCTQLLASGVVLLSKSQFHTEADMDEVEAGLRKLVKDVRAEDTHMPPIIRKNWEDFTEEDFEGILHAGYRHVDHIRMFMNHSDVYSSAMLGGKCEDLPDLIKRVDRLFAEDIFGEVLRVKGFIQDLDKNWYVVNCTRQDRQIGPAAEDIKRGLLVVIGQDLKEDALEQVLLPRKQTAR